MDWGIVFNKHYCLISNAKKCEQGMCEFVLYVTDCAVAYISN